MKNYCLKVAGLERHLPYVDINDEIAFASFVVISDTELVSAAGKRANAAAAASDAAHAASWRRPSARPFPCPAG